MAKVLISGYYGFSNAGDEAMLTAIVDSLKREAPDTVITVISGHPRSTCALHDVKSIGRFDFPAILRAMAGTDLLLSGGGSLLQNVTSHFSLFYYLSIIALGVIMRKKVMLFAQGIGPIKGCFSRFLTRFVCRHADLITVRDDGSLDDLCEMGFERKDILVTSDAVFSLPDGNRKVGEVILRGMGIDPERPVIGFALRHWKGEDRFIPEFARAADGLKAAFGAQILFVPFQFPSDREVSDAVLGQMENSRDVFILPRKLSTKEYLDLMASLRLLVGMRLHALVFAALAGVPFMAVSYDPKVDRFVDGMKGTVVDIIDAITAGEIVSLADSMPADSGAQEASELAALRKEARSNILRALALMHESNEKRSGSHCS